MTGGQREQFFPSVLLRWRGPGQFLSGDEYVGQRILTLEVVGPTPRGDLASPEQVLQRDLALAPVPPRTPLWSTSITQLTGGQRAPIDDLSQHRLDVTRMVLCELLDRLPLPRIRRHLPSEKVVHSHRKQACFVGPVFEQFIASNHRR